MNVREARVRILKRLAATVRNDIDVGEWVFDESDDPKDHERLLKACSQVGRTLDAMIRKRERK